MRVLGAIVVALLVIAAGVGAWVYHDYQRFLNSTITPPHSEWRYTVVRGASIQRIAEELHAQGVIQQPLYLRLYARLSGDARRIQAGDYRLHADMTPQQLLAAMVAGRVVQHSLTVVEGWTFCQLLDAVHAHPAITVTLDGLSDTEIMARLGHPEQHPEGWFLPETYHFPSGTTDLAFLRRAHNAMREALDTVWAQRQADLPFDEPYAALILASIIEKETGVAAERREVAGVFVRRLRRGMLLQTDPTVIYGLGAADFEGPLLRSHLRQDHPHNTYTRPGLPPTPIALPGRAALEAAVDPAPGDTLYFVADGRGGHVFSRTLQEHNRAVQAYRRFISQ